MNKYVIFLSAVFLFCLGRVGTLENRLVAWTRDERRFFLSLGGFWGRKPIPSNLCFNCLSVRFSLSCYLSHVCHMPPVGRYLSKHWQNVIKLKKKLKSPGLHIFLRGVHSTVMKTMHLIENLPVVCDGNGVDGGRFWGEITARLFPWKLTEVHLPDSLEE